MGIRSENAIPQKDAPCTIVDVTGEHCVVDFAEAQWAVTPGQSVVIYESRVCLGGGIIESAQKDHAAASQSGCPAGTRAEPNH
jgi:tRNA U34 2-thiouridine synthase MnmA/TrmU